MTTTPHQAGIKPTLLLLARDGDSGVWVTIHSHHVHIDGTGKIDKGPAHLVGKRREEVASKITAEHGVNHPETGTPEGPANHPGLYTESTLPKHAQGFTLGSDAELSPAVTLGLGLPETYNDQPIHYRWNRCTVSGDYVHPVTGQAVNIDKPRVQKWVGNVKTFLSRKIDIPASTSHKGYKDPRNTLGTIADARERDGELELLVGYIGDDSLAVAQRNKVSIGVESYVDSRGNKYDEAITHLAVTPTPVLPGLPGFVTLSRDEHEAIEPLVPTQKGVEMLDSALKARVTQYLGDTAIPEDTNEVVTLLLGKLDTAPKPDVITALSTENESLKAKVLTLSTEDDEADPKYAGLAYKAHKAEVAALVADATIRKADEPLLLSLIESEAGKPNIMLLSREDENAITFDKVIQLVRTIKPGLIGRERLAAQSIALSREVPVDDVTATASETAQAEAKAEAKAYQDAQLKARGL